MKVINQEHAYGTGKSFTSDVDYNKWERPDGTYCASAFIGEKYYESDPYKSEDLALCEVKGWLEGIKSKIEGCIKAIDDKLK